MQATGRFRRNYPQLKFDLQADSQIQWQTVNQPKVATSGGEGTSDIKQKGVVGRPRQRGKMYALGQQEVEETPDKSFLFKVK